MRSHLSFSDLETIAESLAAGFEALQDQVQEQNKIEHELRIRLERAVEKYEQADRSYNSSSGEISDWCDETVKKINPIPASDDIPTPNLSNEKIDKAQAALERFQGTTMPSAAPIRKCPVTHQATDQEDFEHDFTTPGRIGDLGCPFAQMSNGANAPCGPDPIAEEFHGEKASGRSKSSGGAAGSRCPIRYLDKHSPQEVAQYFENHKHELPRSHQICVKRYQQNEQSIRQLDAKYGNLVSMIQGLGNKHKQYLPQNEKVADEPEQDSSKAVEQWAENVSQQSMPQEEPMRVPRFERPLRDIRVGESPSRPWGISVPVGKSPARSATPSEHVVQSTKPLSIAQNPEPILNPHPSIGEKNYDEPKQEHRHSNIQPQIVFNGPVFFGYSAEQAALFLQNLSTNGGMVQPHS